ncbi:type VI secretion system tube protein TssD [Providencia sneebia]|uniref:Hcp1 family type VI secretion system effector n=1 Tax=Providencia sneebia DSM 19967 TaxID=1141660 RepID=K8W701_9GAMM|nr:type VI secretion system tube protein TssD [Providencia sneebia]EKT56368.1 Hcp1 family type VI secretion system effector [Providencia sneebia DSM 19967]
MEPYYKVKLTKAGIVNLTCFYPNSCTHNDYQPQESVSFKYESITWEHLAAGTSAYSIWEERIY